MRIQTVQGDSGYSQINMVTDVYSHIIDEERRRNAEMYEDAFYEKKELTAEYGKGFTKTNLYHFYSFYKEYPKIFHSASGKSLLSWMHCGNVKRVCFMCKITTHETYPFVFNRDYCPYNSLFFFSQLCLNILETFTFSKSAFLHLSTKAISLSIASLLNSSIAFASAIRVFSNNSCSI